MIDDAEIEWVRRGIDEGRFEDFMVVRYESGAVEVCGYAQHNGPYQQFHHMDDGEREVDVFDERGDCTLYHAQTEAEVRALAASPPPPRA